MASFTMQLREYIEQATQYEDNLSTRERIERGRKKLFDFDYPIFDEEYRPVFETHFIRHFYMREIGFETEGLFKFYLETWLLVHMPYYNQLFKSELIEYDPLSNSQVIVAHEQLRDRGHIEERNSNRRDEGKSKNTAKSTNQANSNSEAIHDTFSRDVSSDNPDSRLQLQTEQGKGVIEYASKIDEEKNDGKVTSTGDSTSVVDGNETSEYDASENRLDKSNANTNEVEHFLERRFGKIGVTTYPKMIMDFRKSFLRLEQQIFNEMNQLFMLIYN